MHVRNVVGFNKQVEESKGKAQDAIKKIPDIENLIKRAENKTQEARDALSGAESDANEALSLAQLAQVTATNASMVSCVLPVCKNINLSACLNIFRFKQLSIFDSKQGALLLTTCRKPAEFARMQIPLKLDPQVSRTRRTCCSTRCRSRSRSWLNTRTRPP